MRVGPLKKFKNPASGSQGETVNCPYIQVLLNTNCMGVAPNKGHFSNCVYICTYLFKFI